jgi:AcrR family transcriptional regulator
MTKTRREEYSEATRRALLTAARALFAKQGYQATGIEAVVQAARLTRGALYHHFEDKRALLDALVVELQGEASVTVRERALSKRSRWESLEAGIEAYLEACLEPAFRRIVLQDAPSVLGIARCREIDYAEALGPMGAALARLKRDGELKVEDTGLLARVLAAMTWEVALLLGDAEDPQTLRRHAQRIIKRVLGAFRVPGTAGVPPAS